MLPRQRAPAGAAFKPDWSLFCPNIRPSLSLKRGGSAVAAAGAVRKPRPGEPSGASVVPRAGCDRSPKPSAPESLDERPAAQRHPIPGATHRASRVQPMASTNSIRATDPPNATAAFDRVDLALHPAPAGRSGTARRLTSDQSRPCGGGPRAGAHAASGAPKAGQGLKTWSVTST